MPGSKATPPVVPVVLQLGTMELAVTGDWSCPACGFTLDLSQPSAQNPDMLLGTCSRCDAWFLYYQNATSPQCRILRLPTEAELESAATSGSATKPESPPRAQHPAPSRGHRRG